MDSAGIRVGGFKVSSATGCRAWRLEKVAIDDMTAE